MNITASLHRVNVRRYHAPLLAPDENQRLRLAVLSWRLCATAALCAAGLMLALLVLSRGDVTYRTDRADARTNSAK